MCPSIAKLACKNENLRRRAVSRCSPAILISNCLWVWMIAIGSAISVAQEVPLDIIHLKNGHSFSGIILQESNDSVHFRQVIRPPGKPTYVLDAVFFRDEIARIERIDEASRQNWLKKLEKLDPRGVHEKKRMAALTLQRSPENNWFYRGQWFTLTSHLSSEELTRRVIVRLEDIFEAFREYFGKKEASKKILAIFLFRDSTTYKQALEQRGLTIVNPAVYIPERSEILVVTEWERLAAQLAAVRSKHQEQLRKLERYEALLRQHFHGQPPIAALEKIKSARLQLNRINQENEAILERQLQPLFRLCYHESFHAYLDLYLFPGATQVIPRWLNEGLAQIFETAVIETGDIRIGHVDVERLRHVQELIKRKSLPKLIDLLQSQARHFQVNHHREAYASDHYFLASWALAYYLLFAQQKASSRETSSPVARQTVLQLLQQLSTSSNPIEVLESYTGKSLQDLECDWQLFFLRLRPDGTLKSLEEIRP